MFLCELISCQSSLPHPGPSHSWHACTGFVLLQSGVRLVHILNGHLRGSKISACSMRYLSLFNKQRGMLGGSPWPADRMCAQSTFNLYSLALPWGYAQFCQLLVHLGFGFLLFLHPLNTCVSSMSAVNHHNYQSLIWLYCYTGWSGGLLLALH